MLELRLLGSIDLRVDDQSCQTVLAQPKRCALLVYLALARRGAFHQRDALLGLFWPEQDQASGRNALGQALHFLRQKVDAELFITRGRSDIAVDTARVKCDVYDLETCLDAADAERALAVYTGELLPSFHVSGMPEFERWLERERQRLAQAVRELVWRTVDARERDGDVSDAVRWARRAFALAPHDERGLRRTLALLERVGDRSGALHLYDEFAEKLRVAYDVEPSPATRAAADALRGRATGAARTAPPASVAVLPFVDMSVTGDQEYFGDGIAEELITALVRVPGLRVTSRTSSFVYRGRTVTIPDIGRELSVGAVVEGSVRCANDQVRITAQLIDAVTDTHLWAQTYDSQLSDVLRTQADIAERIAAELRGALSAAERRRVASYPTDNIEAYQLYLRGRYFCNRASTEDWLRGVEYYERALELEPLFPQVYVALAEAYMQRPLFNFRAPVPRHIALARARAAATRALELNDELGEAHAALAQVLWFDWKWQECERAFLRALALSPSYAIAHQRYAFTLSGTGRFDEARAYLERAQQLDPLSLAVMVDLAVVDLRERRYGSAIAQLSKVLEINPDYAPALHYLGEAYAYEGSSMERSFELAERRGLFSPDENAELRRLLETGGAVAFNRRRYELLQRIRAAPAIIASAAARAGDMEQGFHWLQRAVEERDPALADGIRVHPGFELFRADPRFDAILSDMGLDRSALWTGAAQPQ